MGQTTSKEVKFFFSGRIRHQTLAVIIAPIVERFALLCMLCAAIRVRPIL
jgi:hypothetical protein